MKFEIRNSNSEDAREDDKPSAEELSFWEGEASWFSTPGDEGSGEGVLREDAPAQKVYDLSERTATFGEAVIRFARRIPLHPVNNRLIDQFVGAGTSVGANYCEANDFISAKDFRHRISICRKESKESRFWLRMIATSEPALKDDARVLWREATELNLIFASIWRKAG